MEDNRRILIVEDEEGLAYHLTILLKRINCSPLEAVAYGETAVERAGVLRPDLVLMDINLAGQMDGTEAARLIHDQYGTPVIFLSALTEEMVIHEAQGSEPYGYLVKPVKEPELRAAIEVALYKHGMEARLRESEQRYRLLFEKMNDGFGLGEIITNAEGKPVDFRFLALNPAFERMTGANAGKLIGSSVRIALPQFPAEDLITKFGQIALDGGSAQFEYLMERTRLLLDITVYSPQRGQFATLVKDITDRRRAEHSLTQSVRRMTILRNIDQAITTYTDQNNMSNAILSNVVLPGEVDAAVLFVPNVPGPGRMRGTGPLGMLRMSGLAGLPESVVDSSVLNWQMVMANHVFTSCQPLYINDLRQENHPGAQTLYRMAGFSACAALPLLARGQAKGVLQFFQRHAALTDLDSQTFLQSLALQTAIGIDHVEMLENLKRSNRELAQAYEETIKGWAQALELRDLETRGHADRVVELTQRLAEAMGIHEPDLTHLKHGALLHDVGKMAIPDSILRKTGPLSTDEWVTMRQHPQIAYNMLYNIEYLRPALDVVYAHHEKWDGTGYPRQLKGDEIPISARIFAVVDVWDALTTDRYYRLAWPKNETRSYIAQQSGKHFDPKIVEVFEKLIEQA